MTVLHRRANDDTELQDPAIRRDGGRAATAVATPVDERLSTTTHAGWNTAMRLIGLAAGAVALLIGVAALLRLDWGAGLDAHAVEVLGVAFTPVVAIVTTVAALVAMAAAATPERSSKLVVGAVLACVGAAIVLASDANRANVDVERAHGWLALGVGAVLVVTGLLLRRSWATHRRVQPRY